MAVKQLSNQVGPFIWHYLKHKKIYLIGFFLVACITALEMSLSPYLLKVILDKISRAPAEHSNIIAALFLPILLYIALSFFLNVNFRFKEYLNRSLYPKLRGAMQKDVIQHLLNHSPIFFQNAFSGNLTKKVIDIGMSSEQIIQMQIDAFLPRLLSCIVASVLLVKVVHPFFGIGLILWTIMFVCFSFIVAKRFVGYSKKRSEAMSQFAGSVSDTLFNVISTKLFNNVTHEIAYIDKSVQTMTDSDCAARKYISKINFWQSCWTLGLLIFMLYGLLYGVQGGWITAGDFVLVLTLSMAFMQSIYSLCNQMQNFSNALGSCKQALGILRTPYEIIDAKEAKPLMISEGEIKFDRVSFGYNQMNLLFKNLSVTIHPGERIGLVGHSGAGKSTFLKLILRLIDTMKGDILIDGQPIKSVTQDSLRDQITTIQQEPELFHRTLMENIRYGKITASDEEVIEAAKKAKCHGFIMAYPKQYQTLVGERGVKLSGGQKQRIAIARAFLKNAPILFLDEATSALDSITEREIQDALSHLMKNKTTIVIAHRLSTLKNMDRILVFNEGEIIENDSFDALFKNEIGHFHQLWKAQSFSVTPKLHQEEAVV